MAQTTVAEAAAHLVAAAFILNNSRPTSSEARHVAQEQLGLAEALLEQSGLLPKQSFCGEHASNTPEIIRILGKPVFIPHQDGSTLKVDMALCQEIFRTIYGNAFD